LRVNQIERQYQWDKSSPTSGDGRSQMTVDPCSRTGHGKTVSKGEKRYQRESKHLLKT